MPATPQIAFANECHSKGQPKRAPRAPNAFMLYRSDFLKRRTIPPEIERRQQNLSRIAGQCWNMLPETDKAIWYGKAAAVRAEHCARYPSHKTGPFRKDTNRLSVEDERSGSAINPRRPCGRSRSRRTQTPYPGYTFAAIQDPRSSPPTSLTLVSELPLSTTAPPSPLSLLHSLPSFTSYTSSSSQDTRSAISDLQNIPSGIGSFQEPYPTLNDFTTRVPYPGLEQIVSQLPSILSMTNAFSPAEYNLASCQPLANNFGVTDNVAHFNPSLVPLYPSHSD